MTTTTLNFSAGEAGTAPADHASSLKVFFAKIAARIVERRRARADADVAYFLAINGGTLSDQIERQICRNYGRTFGY